MPSVPGGLQPSGHALCLRILEKNSIKGGCNAAGQRGIHAPLFVDVPANARYFTHWKCLTIQKTTSNRTNLQASR